MVAHDFNTSTTVRGTPCLNCISQEGQGYVLRPGLSNKNINNNNNNNSNSNNNFKMYNVFWSYLSPLPPTLFSRVSPCRQGTTCSVSESIVWCFKGTPLKKHWYRKQNFIQVRWFGGTHFSYQPSKFRQVDPAFVFTWVRERDCTKQTRKQQKGFSQAICTTPLRQFFPLTFHVMTSLLALTTTSMLAT